jgi:uridine kinase
MIMISHDLVKKIKTLKKPSLIAISGFGGSGKSTFTNALAVEIGGTVLGVDHFFTSTKRTDYENWEIVDFGRLKKEIIKPFLQGSNPLKFHPFDWEANAVGTEVEQEVKDILILEGVGLFRPELINLFSYKIWIDCSLEVATERGKRRDKEDYGVNQDHFWDGIWTENEMQYWERCRPKEMADYLVNRE